MRHWCNDSVLISLNVCNDCGIDGPGRFYCVAALYRLSVSTIGCWIGRYIGGWCRVAVVVVLWWYCVLTVVCCGAILLADALLNYCGILICDAGYWWYYCWYCIALSFIHSLYWRYWYWWWWLTHCYWYCWRLCWLISDDCIALMIVDPLTSCWCWYSIVVVVMTCLFIDVYLLFGTGVVDD